MPFPDRPLRLMIADDHAIFTETLAHFLSNQPDLEVVAQAQSGEEAIRMLEDEPVDIVLMDIRMTGQETDGLDAALYLYRNFRDIKVIMLSSHKLGAYIHQVFNAGIAGYVLKKTQLEELFTAIRTVSAGKRYYNMEVREAMDQYILSATDTEQEQVQLTRTEQEILELLAEGYSSKMIADVRKCAENTVEVHRRNLMLKFGVPNVAKLIREAFRRGFLTLD